MVVAAEHLRLQVVADAVYQVDFQERLAADEVPHDTLLAHLILVVEDIVYGRLGHLPRHPLLRVLAHEVAVLASQLAVLRDDEGDVLRHAGLPRLFLSF